MAGTHNENIAIHTNVLLKQLNEFERAPKGFLQSWQETQEAEESCVAKILLQEGSFTVWFAYFLLKNAAENQCHFSGKADCRQLVAALDDVSLEHLKGLATGVLRGVLPEVKVKLDRLHEKTSRQPQSSAILQPSKRRRVDGDNAVEDTSLALFRANEASPVESGHTRPPLDTFNGFADEEHVLVNASLADTTRLFPPYLASAIKRIPDPQNENMLVAAIAMTFPNSPVTDRFGCQMALEITENKVEYVAKELFGVHLETTAGLRYVYLPGGAKVLPNPKSTLRGGQDSAISSIFGPEIYSAIRASPVYQDDIKQGRVCTECLSMVISHGSHEGALIFASLGPREGTLIRDKLYS